MGLGNFFKPKAEAASTAPVTTEKQTTLPPPPPPPLPQPTYEMELQPPVFRGPGSSRNSLSARSVHSNRSTQSSAFLDDIKHEVMVNYLYQQQCSQLWVSDGSGEIEGVLLRKSKNTYMACPPQLGTSAFAASCAALNVQVRLISNIAGLS